MSIRKDHRPESRGAQEHGVSSLMEEAYLASWETFASSLLLPNESNVRQEGLVLAHSLRKQSTVMAKTWQQGTRTVPQEDLTWNQQGRAQSDSRHL